MTACAIPHWRKLDTQKGSERIISMFVSNLQAGMSQKKNENDIGRIYVKVERGSTGDKPKK